MTSTAREVLDDCRGAVEEIANEVEGRAWRRRWVAAVVLLRTVGYVLKNVDARHNEAYKSAIHEAWVALKSSKPETPILGVH